MTEYRGKLMQKIAKKIGSLIEETELLLDAELRHIDEYDACAELCRNMGKAAEHMRLAMYAMQQAEAEAELEDMQEQMQQNLKQITG